MLLADLLDTAHLELRLRYEAPGGLQRPVGRVVTTDLLEPGGYLAGSELVLTELAWRRSPDDSETFVRSIAERGVSTLVTGTVLFGPAPEDLVEACRRHGVTLIEVPPGVAFIDVTDHLTSVDAAESGSRLSAGLVRQRELLGSMAAGRSLPEIVARVAREIGHDCRVLTPTGRFVVVGDHELGQPAVDGIVHEFLSATVLPAVVRTGDETHSLFAVGSGLGHRPTGWMLVVDGDHHEWPREHVDAVGDLGAIVALDRTRHDERLRAVRPIAADVLALVEAGAPTPEVASRLRQAGADPEAALVVLAADLGAIAGDDAAGLVEDVALTIGTPVVAADREGRVVALLPDAPDLVRRVRAAAARLAAGLSRDERLAVGVSGATGVTALSGALDEARFAVRAARAGGGQVSVVGSEEVTSHVLLLAAVPDDVRRAYALRVLGTLVEHDVRSGTDLVETLRTFLGCSGSWTRTADALHLHVNTVRYRVQRVQELIGRDLARFDDRVDVYLALESL
ncbi:PucR family transcriptional regulator [Nocardioides panacisoli]|uniref:PucR family transcriptional regulator ligand-binding domain-containing protein n=1 Tax=Nocardioides panacisoli TaxID=627624 RepID=A0ABP7J3H8_9ACTN